MGKVKEETTVGLCTATLRHTFTQYNYNKNRAGFDHNLLCY